MCCCACIDINDQEKFQQWRAEFSYCNYQSRMTSKIFWSKINPPQNLKWEGDTKYLAHAWLTSNWRPSLYALWEHLKWFSRYEGAFSSSKLWLYYKIKLIWVWKLKDSSSDLSLFWQRIFLIQWAHESFVFLSIHCDSWNHKQHFAETYVSALGKDKNQNWCVSSLKIWILQKNTFLNLC